MNLINDPWIPIRRKSGAKALIAPWQLTETDDPVIALNAPRPDFNGALMQFLIGLLQTTATPASHDQWLDWLEEPPAPEVLKAQFEPYADAFALQGGKGSFMQDFELLEGAGFNGIAELLIDSPGGNTVKEVFPVSVGMNRPNVAMYLSPFCVPRICGDEPRSLRLSPFFTVCSPYLWG